MESLEDDDLIQSQLVNTVTFADDEEHAGGAEQEVRAGTTPVGAGWTRRDPRRWWASAKRNARNEGNSARRGEKIGENDENRNGICKRLLVLVLIGVCFCDTFFYCVRSFLY